MKELSLHILDLVENSLAAHARQVTLAIEEDHRSDRLVIHVSDDGRGMDAETCRRALDPFFTTRTTRHVGLGLPLLMAAAERCGGHLELTSTLGLGTQVIAQFQHSHIDRAPLGDMPATLMGILCSGRSAALHYTHRVDERLFVFHSDQIQALLEDVPLSHPSVRDWLWAYLNEGERELYAADGQAG